MTAVMQGVRILEVTEEPEEEVRAVLLGIPVVREHRDLGGHAVRHGGGEVDGVC